GQARLFGAAEVIPVAIELSEDAFERLRAEPREWVPGAITIDGQHFGSVGVRLKGGASFKPITSKAAFKIDLDRYVPAQLYGLRKLTFNNMVQDHTKVSERLASTAFARFGLPAPRVGYAEITVNGELYGLYSHVETPDERFLQRVFPGDGGGPLYEGDYDQDLWPRFIDLLDRDAGEDPGRRALARAIAGLDRAIPATFNTDVGAVVDLDQARRFFAAEMALGHWDGYANQRNNYFVYLRPSDGRLVFLPWGTDQLFRRTTDPFAGRGRVFRMCADWLACRLPYAETVSAYADAIEQHDFAAEIDQLWRVIGPAQERDPKTSTNPERRADALEDMLEFIAAHPERLRNALRCLDPSADADGDGTLSCAGDCNDRDPTIYPNAFDTCDDEIDQDCSGFTDDAEACPVCRTTVAPTGATFLLCHRPESYSGPTTVCAEQGAELASVRSAEEEAFVAAAAFARRRTRWFIGLRPGDKDDTWQWLDGAPVDYTAWAQNEPNGNGGCTVIDDR
ncbi:MAG: CotH kinase family protein, partial [Myxococcales bacterium]|nr:CotH kinase family protein [Myxococcales bacterium]